MSKSYLFRVSELWSVENKYYKSVKKEMIIIYQNKNEKKRIKKVKEHYHYRILCLYYDKVYFYFLVYIFFTFLNILLV